MSIRWAAWAWAIVLPFNIEQGGAAEATRVRGTSIAPEPALRQDGAVPTQQVLGSVTLLPPVAEGACCLPRNFGAVVPPETIVQPVSWYGGPPNYLARPWYATPYRNYAYYRPWYTYGSYGPIHYRYHYAPSWGYAPGPYYAPPYLSPGAYGPPDGSAVGH